MKRLLAILLAVMFVVTTNVYAKGKGKPAPKAESFKEMFSKGTVNGQFRTRWFARDYDQESKTDWNTFAVGGELHAQTAQWAGVSMGVGFYTIQDFGLNDDDDVVYNHLMAKDDNGHAESSTALGEYFINYKISKTNIKIGAQKMRTAWLMPWDARLVPKTHEAVWIRSREFKDLEISLGHVFREKDTVSEEFEYISQAVAEQFKSVGGDADEGVSFLEFKYNGFKGFKTWLAYHHFHDIFSNTFFDIRYDHTINDNVKWFTSFRIVDQNGVGDELYVGDGFDTYFYGGRLGFEYHGATLIAHYSTMGDDPLAFLRGHNKIIQMQFLGNARADEDAYLFEFEYKLHKLYKPLKGMKVKFSYGIFDMPDAPVVTGKNEDRTEFDIRFQYKVPGPLKGLNVVLRYAQVDGDSVNSPVDFDDYRLILNYSF